MNNLDLLKMGFNNLWRRKARTFLTILGVIIGTGSIVIMLSLGIAMDQSFKAELENMGSLNIIEVYKGWDRDGGNSQQAKLDDNTTLKIEKIPGVKAVMPTKREYMRVVAGKLVADISIIGIKPEIMEEFDFEAEQGRLLLSSDKNAIVFGKEMAREFYNPRSRIRNYNRESNVNLISNKLLITSDMNYGEKRREKDRDRDTNKKPPKPHKISGVGMLAEGNGEYSYNAYMNVTALKKIIEEDRRATKDDDDRRRQRDDDAYDELKVKVEDIEKVQSVQEKIKQKGLEAYSLTDMLESMKKQSAMMQAILGGIGAVSLFVAALGITNTMIMSIYERTREIGVMKVLGANLSDIKKLFLLEAGMIGFAGGVVGLGLSYTISFILNKVAGGFMMMGGGGDTGISVIPIWLSGAGLAFSTVVGIVSGYYPAQRAMKLSALAAIKTE